MLALASDFDGTLYFGEKEGFKEENSKRIKEFQQRGNLFGLCTGRPLGGVTERIRGHVVPDFYILATGAVILDKELNIIYEKPMPVKLVKEIYDRCPDNNKPAIQAGNDLYVFKQKSPYPIEQILIQEFEELPDENIYQFSVNGDSVEDAKNIAKKINKEYGDYFVAYQNVAGVDVVSCGCSKGTGLKMLKEKLNLDCLCGIGDSYNDLPMLAEADKSFTFDYAPEDIQKEADYVVKNIAEAIDILGNDVRSKG